MITPRSQLNDSGSAVSLSNHILQGDDQNGDNNSAHLLIEHSYSCLSSQEHVTNPSNGSTIANGSEQVTHPSHKEATDDFNAPSHPEPRVNSTSSPAVSAEPSPAAVSNGVPDSSPSNVNTNGRSKKPINSTPAETPSSEMSLRTRSGRERKVPAKLLDQDFIDTSEMLLPSGRKGSGDASSLAAQISSKSSPSKDARRNSKSPKPSDPVKEAEDSEDDDESEDEENDDDDPFKEYCICRKPHGNKFMIACDNCEDWFHGKCIGVSKKQSENFEVWICSKCKENNPSLQCKVKAISSSPAAAGMSDGRKRLPSESSDGNKINDRVKRTGPHTKGSDVRIKKLSKVEVANGLPNKSKDKSAETNSDEEKDKVRLKELIDKRKRELAEKEKKRERKLAQLDPSMNQLFQMDSGTDHPRKKNESTSDAILKPSMRCLVCTVGKLKKDTTVYCSLDCIKTHVKNVRRSKRRPSTNINSTHSPTVKESEPAQCNLSTVPEATKTSQPEANRKISTEKTLTDSVAEVPSLTVGAGDATIKEEKDNSEQKVEPEKEVKEKIESEEKVDSGEEKKLEENVKVEDNVASSAATAVKSTENQATIDRVNNGQEAKADVCKDTKADACKETKVDSCKNAKTDSCIMYPVYDAFDAKDTADTPKKKAGDVAERELLHFLIRNPSYTLDPSLKVKYKIRRSSEASEASSKDSRRTSLDSMSRSSHHSSGSKITAQSKRKSESDCNIPSKSSKPSHDVSSKSNHKSKATSKSSSTSSRSEDVRERQVREKVEKSLIESLDTRITHSSHLDAAEKEKRKSKVAGLCKSIESELFKLFATGGKLSDVSQKNYLSKYRSLLFNLKDSKNQFLFDSLFVVNDEATASSSAASTLKLTKISPANLVRMTSEELARGSDLDEWRKEETKKSIINSVIMNEEQLEASQSINVAPKRQKDEVTSEMDLMATLPVDALPEVIKSDASHHSRSESGKSSQPVKIRMSKSRADFNPLDLILGEISTKGKSKELPIDEVPKSPPPAHREKRRREEHRDKSKDRLHELAKKKKESDGEKKKSVPSDDNKNTSHKSSGSKAIAVKRVIIQPKLPELMNVDLLSGELNEPNVDKLILPRETKIEKVLWEGFCSGFEDSAASSKEPGASRFPLVWLKFHSSNEEPSPKDDPPPSMTSEFTCLNVVGRIAPDLVASYVQRVISISNDSVSNIDLIPLTPRMKRKKGPLEIDEYAGGLSDYLVDEESYHDADEESLSFKENYDKFISYLGTRKRYAVVNVDSGKKFNMKDMYLLPLDLSTVDDQVKLRHQMPSDVLLDIFSRSASCADIRKEASKVKKMILLAILVKKSRDKRRDRSGSTSTSLSSTASPAQLKYVPSIKSSLLGEGDRDQRDEQRSYTPPPLTVPLSVKASLAQQYQPTPIISMPQPSQPPAISTQSKFPSLTSQSVKSSSLPRKEEEETIPTSYIPGLSPDRDDSPNDHGDMDDEEELKQKAMLQMQMLNYTPL